MAWQQILIQLAIVIASYAFTVSRTPKPSNATVEESQLPAVKSGQNVSVLFGKVWVKSPAIIYSGNKGAYPIKQKVGK